MGLADRTCLSVSVSQLRPPTVIGQFHTLFFGSVRMFFLGVLGFAVYGNEALHFSCDPDRRELNLFCYNQFRPITPQVGQNRRVQMDRCETNQSERGCSFNNGAESESFSKR